MIYKILIIIVDRINEIVVVHRLLCMQIGYLQLVFLKPKQSFLCIQKCTQTGFFAHKGYSIAN